VLAVGSQRLTLTPADVAGARARARRSRRPHNRAREGFLRDLLDLLAQRLATSIGTTLSSDNREGLLEDLRESPDVRRELNLAWLPITPERLLSDLFGDPARLAAAAPDLSAGERELLRRDHGAPWTVADVPLLDELAELMGEVTSADRAATDAAARIRRAEDLANAEAALRNVDSAIRPTVEQLADRFAETGPVLTVAERAAADRSWAYGHLVVDEAQELSPMMWRLLMRRSPTRSMTLVGDVAQVGSAAGASSWDEVLSPYVQDRWRLAELTVNYRTPSQVMQLASDMLAAAGIDAPTPESVREGDWKPVAQEMRRGDDAAVVDAVRAELELLGEGRLAVVTVRGAEDALHDALAAALPEGTVGFGADTLDRPVSVLAVVDVKGLEFDAVVLVEPGDILAGSARGANDLYVALTRPTQRLRVLHSDPLPAGLTGLATA
jgi:DNA helicase IV